MSALAEFSSLVATLYEAASDPQQWQRFLGDYYKAMNATRGALTAVATRPEIAKVVLEGYTESELCAYSDYYFQHDVVLQAGMDTMTRQAQWVGSVDEILPYRTLERSEIYNDYYRNLNMHHAACLMIGATEPYSALGLAAWRPQADGPFQPDELRLAELIAPHLTQAFRLHANLNSLRVQAQSFHAALDATAIAVIALRSDGHILTSSPAAEECLAAMEILLQRGGRLCAANSERDRLLQQMIHTAGRVGDLDLQAPGYKATLPGGSLLLHRAGKAQPLQVQILPVLTGGASTGPSPAVLVFITDPAAIPPSRARVLQQLYRLTPVEARLADLFLGGQELKEAAEQLKLTYDNTRFHLKQIFRKTNTTRQAELLRLLLAIPV